MADPIVRSAGPVAVGGLGRCTVCRVYGREVHPMNWPPHMNVCIHRYVHRICVYTNTCKHAYMHRYIDT